MILTELTVSDFGSFRGRQTIKLLPQRGRPIILIGGKNGAGKTTLLEAIRLCFYGPHSSGFRSKDDYLRYLDSKIHVNPNSIVQPTVASVAVEFQYSDIEAVNTYKISRSWERRSSGKVQEILAVERNGRALDEITSEHWPDFVRDLIPPGVAQLFFFDGEKIQHLADDNSDQRELAEAIKALLGLDTVERLEIDLDIYRSRAIKNLREVAGGKEVEELQHGIKHLEGRLTELRGARQVQESRIAELRLSIARIQDKISVQGGSFARNRDKLVHERAVLQTRVGHLEETLRTMCAGLLPFAVVPDLCSTLKTQLANEQATASLAAGKGFLESAQHKIAERMEDVEFWAGLPKMTRSAHNELQRRVTRVFDEIGFLEQTKQIESVHRLSPSVAAQLISWMDGAAELSGTLAGHSAEVERLYRELHAIEAQLRKIPADELLRPLLEELQRANEELAGAGKSALLTDESIRTVELELASVRRNYERCVERISSQARHGSQVQLVPKIQQVLDEFRSALLGKKLQHLQHVVTHSFNALCRKKDSVREISINPEDFSVTFKGKDGGPISKSQLSAGEKQIYAISMLWGLAKTSGRPLPIVIDTPLGRLDTDHRRLLTEHYFPFASHQVVILSTDSEIDQVYFRDLKRSISQAYRLDFSMEENHTTLNGGYFWNEAN